MCRRIGEPPPGKVRKASNILLFCGPPVWSCYLKTPLPVSCDTTRAAQFAQHMRDTHCRQLVLEAKKLAQQRHAKSLVVDPETSPKMPKKCYALRVFVAVFLG